MTRGRRDFLRAASVAVAGALVSRPIRAAKTASVIVVGGGFAGATAAKYLGKWSAGALRVTLVERASAFVSCPLSNLVLGGMKEIAELTFPYDGLDRWGVRRITGEATAIDPVARTLKLAGGETLRYDRLILSPGMDFDWDAIPSLKDPPAREKILHAWKAGPQTVALRRQLEAMPDGGVFAMHVPLAPYRCPPAPYERACLVAQYFAARKKRS